MKISKTQTKQKLLGNCSTQGHEFIKENKTLDLKNLGFCKKKSEMQEEEKKGKTKVTVNKRQETLFEKMRSFLNQNA